MEKKRGPKQPLKHLPALRKTLHFWFAENGRVLPWRRTRDPWAILVSEIMLQQTTVAAVVANRRFENFLAEFPDFKTIAKAAEPQLLKAWEGLGYYNRVRNLQKTAIEVLESHHGNFPQDAATLETLPGIGRYTAGAVSSFAYDQAAPIVDANIARVLARLFDFQDEIDSTPGQKQIWEWAEELLDFKNPRLFNSAIMELGQTHCSSNKPNCLVCPLKQYCQTQTPEDLPRKKPRRKMVIIEEHALLWVSDGKIYLTQEEGSRRKGFWRLPLATSEETAHLEAQSTHRYTITHHKVTLSLYPVKTVKTKGEFFGAEELKELPIASPIRRVIESAF